MYDRPIMTKSKTKNITTSLALQKGTAASSSPS